MVCNYLKIVELMFNVTVTRPFQAAYVNLSVVSVYSGSLSMPRGSMPQPSTTESVSWRRKMVDRALERLDSGKSLRYASFHVCFVLVWILLYRNFGYNVNSLVILPDCLISCVIFLWLRRPIVSTFIKYHYLMVCINWWG